MTGENAAQQYNKLLEQQGAVKDDLKRALMAEVKGSAHISALFAPERHEDVAQLLIDQAAQFKTQDAATAEASARQAALDKQREAEIEEARDKRSVDEIEADRIREEVRAEADATGASGDQDASA